MHRLRFYHGTHGCYPPSLLTSLVLLAGFHGSRFIFPCPAKRLPDQEYYRLLARRYVRLKRIVRRVFVEIFPVGTFPYNPGGVLARYFFYGFNTDAYRRIRDRPFCRFYTFPSALPHEKSSQLQIQNIAYIIISAVPNTHIHCYGIIFSLL